MGKEDVKSHYRFKVLQSDINRTKLEKFDCNYKNLNTFLNKEAIEYSPYKFGVTTLVYDKNNLVAYYTLRNTSLLFSPDSKNRCLPAIEIFRLAVDKSRQDDGIGSYIIKKIVADSNKYANTFSLAVVILVNADADERCIKFYTDNKFFEIDHNFFDCINEPFNSNKCVPMWLKLKVN